MKINRIGIGVGAYKWQQSYIGLLKEAIDLGVNFIDTAEEYDNGFSEEIVGEAISNNRSNVFISTKFSPQHNSYQDVLKSVDGSLKRLGVGHIDVYQVHWLNPDIRLQETIAAMLRLIEMGKIRHLGVCNFYLSDLKHAQLLSENKIDFVQIEYNLFDRTVENGFLEFCQKNNITVIAYSPLDQGRVCNGKSQLAILQRMAEKYNKSVSQIALSWILMHQDIIVIPKANNRDHLLQNINAFINLDVEDYEAIDRHCRTALRHIDPNRIYVTNEGQGCRQTYSTIEDAYANKLNFIPSPKQISKGLLTNDFIKPVRLQYSQRDDFEYSLIEGRMRYWGWKMAFGDRLIPAYVREEL